MTTQSEPMIVLYDLACTKNTCFSPIVWRIRMMLNYKKIPYRTIFLEFPDIEPTLKELGLSTPESTSGSQPKYTLPVVHHVPTNKYMMDSKPISQFLESTYPDPPLPLTSELGSEIEGKSRTVVSKAFRPSILPREILILSPRSQDFFRRTREAALGHRLEDLLDSAKEEQTWSEYSDDISSVDKLIRTHQAEGPFVLGAKPSYTDFFIAGNLQFARVVEEEVFQRIVKYPGFKAVYEACLPYMGKKD